MKLLGIIFIIALTCCGQVNQTENKVRVDRQTDDTFKEIEIQKTDFKFPDWLAQLYPNEIKLKYRTIGQELTDFKKLNDSVAYCTYNQMDGVCLWSFIKTYVNKTQVDSLEIGQNCDHDLSQPTYSWKEYEFNPLNIISLTKYIESVHDSLIDKNGYVKEKYDFLESETIIDSTRQLFQVEQNGMIKGIEK